MAPDAAWRTADQVNCRLDPQYRADLSSASLAKEKPRLQRLASTIINAVVRMWKGKVALSNAGSLSRISSRFSHAVPQLGGLRSNVGFSAKIPALFRSRIRSRPSKQKPHLVGRSIVTVLSEEGHGLDQCFARHVTGNLLFQH